MGRRKTQQEWEDEVFLAVGNEYVFNEPYVNSSTKLSVTHNIQNCGHTYMVKPNTFLTGRRCPKCSLANRKQPKPMTNSEWLEKLDELGNGEYICEDTYVRATENVTLVHTGGACGGNRYEVKPTNFLRGSRCPKCSKDRGDKKNTKSNGDWVKEVYELVGDEFTFLEEYKGTHKPIKAVHNKEDCQHVFKIAPKDFAKHRKCPECSRKAKMKTNREFLEQVESLVGDEYTFTEEYNGDNKKISVIHNVCGYEYSITPNNFINGTRCANCRRSKGELDIMKVLGSLGVDFEEQKTFPGLVNIKPLRYDFYIPSMGILIEYNGRQHYEPVDYFGGDEAYKTQVKNDTLKRQYAEDKNYTLLEIPHTVKDIDKISEIISEEISSRNARNLYPKLKVKI